MIISAEYEEEKRAQRPPWWRFWAQKGTTTSSTLTPPPNPTPDPTADRTPDNNHPPAGPNTEEEAVPSPRLAILCDSPPVEIPGSGWVGLGLY
ncbi:hypothetical protein VN97_g1788 [Penicillium thymicola]|uniref:Uncharacterized protein n=1 Tax=Penicillium thymicola TaxID=293382 RepID=A0AAI9XBZ2_PENTH|nr:hypothetical protein VN97_g1788 [Penicillium thymicola]